MSSTTGAWCAGWDPCRLLGDAGVWNPAWVGCRASARGMTREGGPDIATADTGAGMACWKDGMGCRAAAAAAVPIACCSARGWEGAMKKLARAAVLLAGDCDSGGGWLFLTTAGPGACPSAAALGRAGSVCARAAKAAGAGLSAAPERLVGT